VVRVQHYKLAGEPVRIYSPESASDALEFLDWIHDKRELGLDTEASGKIVYEPDFKVRLFQVGTRNEAWCLPVDEGFNWAIRRVLADTSRTWVLHNAPFDVVALHRHGLADGYSLIDRCLDSYITAHLNDPREKKAGGIGLGLKEQIQEYIDPEAPDAQAELHRMFREELGCKRQADGWKVVPKNHPTYLLYGGLDPIFAVRLRETHLPAVHASGQASLIDTEHHIQQITTRMILRGIKLDVGYAEKLSADLWDDYEYWCHIADDLGVENVNSTQQVAAALMADGWEPEHFTPKAKEPQVSDDILEELAEKGFTLAHAVVEAKRAQKFNTAYAEASLDLRDSNDRIHPMIASLRARTARMSISTPPLQQLPSEDDVIRGMYVADDGFQIISCDYQAVEMRVLAALANVYEMRKAIYDGRDLHGYTAELVFGSGYTKDDRKVCKAVGFGKVYGGGAKTLAKQTGVEIDRIKTAIAAYDAAFPEIQRHSLALMDEAKHSGYTIRTPSGRVLPVDKERIYSATNYEIQSSARDLFGHDLIEMSDAGLEPYLLLPIHDEVLAQAPEREALEVSREIESIMTWPDYHGVPIAAEAEIYGSSWGHGYRKAA
jgi:DNA polymerase-1